MSRPIEDLRRGTPSDGPAIACQRVGEVQTTSDSHRLFLENFGGIAYHTLDLAAPPCELVGAVEEISGYSAVEFLAGRIDWLTLVHPDDIAAVRDERRRLADPEQESVTAEYRIQARSGALRWVRETIRAADAADNNGRVFQGAIYDITERRLAEEALREGAEWTQILFEHAADAICVCTPDGKIVQANEEACRSTGYTLEEMLRLHITELDPQVGGTGAVRGSRGLFMPERPVTIESLHRRKDGSTFPVEVTIAPLQTPAGPRVMGIARDITARKRVEAARERRLLALTRPLDTVGDIAFEELLNVDDLQRLQDQYAAATGVASIITRPDGTPITAPSNFCRLCKDVIRQTEKGCANCFHSDAVIGRYNPHGPIVQPCLSGGLWDAGAAISVGGKHVANWLIGQVRDETQTEEHMRAYAREIDADEDAVIAAFREVPAMSRARFDQIAQALFTLANQLSTMAFQNLQQARFIAELKRADEELRRNEALLDEMGRIARIGGWEHDLTTGAARWTRGTYATVEIEPGAPIPGPREHLDYYPPEGRRVLERAYQQAVETGEPFDVEVPCHTATGRAIWVRVLGRPIFTDGRCVKMQGTLQDVTARRQTEDERDQLHARLQQAQKLEAIGQLAGGVAHDFNNILTAILGNVEFAINELSTRFPAAQGALEGLRQIDRSAQRAATLTRQLLAFSRRQVIRPHVLDLNATLRELEKLLRRLLSEDIALQIDCAASLAPIRADAGQLEQVIVNLVVNARDALREGGLLRITTANVQLDEAYAALHPEARPGAHVLLAVSDTGCGMDHHTIEHAFEPFFTTKPVGQGTGLGLATVYGIVQQAGGSVTIESAVGRGTTLNIYFPAARGVPVEPERSAPHGEPPGGDETIIVCEDDTAVLERTTQVLRDAGYTVLAASSGPAALALAQAYVGPIALLVTDVIMPDMNGRKLADALRVLRPGLRTLFVSGYAGDVIGRHGILEDEVEFLEKPFSRSQVLARVRAILDHVKT